MDEPAKTEYLTLVNKFKETNSSRFAQETSKECLLMFLEFVLKQDIDGLTENDHICTDNSCFCNKYKLGDVMLNCDGGCMYPGA